jgi:hypothetical protein
LRKAIRAHPCGFSRTIPAQNLVSTITSLCEHSRSSRAAVHETIQDLFKDIDALGEKIHQGADKAEVRALIESMRRKRDLIDKAIKTHGKA